MSKVSKYDDMFSGIIGEEYDMLNLICPLATEMSRQVGKKVAEYQAQLNRPIKVLELGGGTGITTLAILSACDQVEILSVDSEPTMQNQAKESLKQWQEQGVLTFSGQDALSALLDQEAETIDVIASAYTLHNFQDDYRAKVVTEMFRVLKPGGQFINGDRYGLDDITEHTRLIQQEVSGYFEVLTKLNRLDLLEHWIVHLFSDESENHVMRESAALKQLQDAGFSQIDLTNREAVNALVSSIKL